MIGSNRAPECAQSLDSIKEQQRLQPISLKLVRRFDNASKVKHSCKLQSESLAARRVVQNRVQFFPRGFAKPEVIELFEQAV